MLLHNVDLVEVSAGKLDNLVADGLLSAVAWLTLAVCVLLAHFPRLLVELLGEHPVYADFVCAESVLA